MKSRDFQDPQCTREAVRFQMGQIVKEVGGVGEDAKVVFSKIAAITNDDLCMTDTCRWYDRLTGKSISVTGPYHAIHLADSKVKAKAN